MYGLPDDQRQRHAEAPAAAAARTAAVRGAGRVGTQAVPNTPPVAALRYCTALVISVVG